MRAGIPTPEHFEEKVIKKEPIAKSLTGKHINLKSTKDEDSSFLGGGNFLLEIEGSNYAVLPRKELRKLVNKGLELLNCGFFVSE